MINSDYNETKKLIKLCVAVMEFLTFSHKNKHYVIMSKGELPTSSEVFLSKSLCHNFFSYLLQSQI